MERNHLIGFILIFATLLIWNVVNQPSKEVLEKRKRLRDSLENLDKGSNLDSSNIAKLPVSMDTTTLKSTFGSFADASKGVAKDIALENEFVKLTFNTKGGYIKEAVLKKHVKTVKDENGKWKNVPVVLLGNPDNKFEYIFTLSNGKDISTRDLYFTPTLQGNTLSLSTLLADNGAFTQKYTLGTDYVVDYTISSNNLASSVQKKDFLKFNWSNFLPQNERGAQFEQNYSTAYFKESDQRIDYCSCVSADNKDADNKPIEWISHTNQFFNTTIIPQKASFAGAKMATAMVDIKETQNVKHITSEVNIPLDISQDGKFDMKLYVGPNEYNRLKGLANDLEEIIPFGSSIFGTINRWAIRPFFDFLSSFIGSKGIVIIALIFLIKMLLYPLMYKTLYSQAKMSALKPEIDQIKAKNKDDMQKQQVETMKLYQEYGVSPLGGCLPMLLQAPIWYALFRFFPASITFRQEPFLWASDLSSYDVLFNLGFEIPFFGSHVSLFTLLWAVSTLIYTYYSMQNVDMSANPAMKYVQYFMPIMFLAFFNNYASGLTCYMFFSNLINIIQTVATKKYIFDEAKIRKELLAEKAKPKKKSGFQARLEEAMKQQEALRDQKKKK
jgi:YidC/Oxa1 family membrane protein insertase